MRRYLPRRFRRALSLAHLLSVAGIRVLASHVASLPAWLRVVLSAPPRAHRTETCALCGAPMRYGGPSLRLRWSTCSRAEHYYRGEPAWRPETVTSRRDYGQA